MDNLNIKKIFSYSTGFLALIATVKLINFSSNYGVPIFSFISFANVIGYILDVVYGSAIFILFGILIYLFRGTFILPFFAKRADSNFSYFFAIAAYILFLVIYHFTSGGSGSYWPFILRLLLFAGLLSLTVFFIQCGIIIREEINILVVLMISLFIYFGGKVLSNNDYAITKTRVYDQIIFKDGTKFCSDSLHWCIGNTSDFVFVFDSKTKCYTAYPMVEIKEISQKRMQNISSILEGK
jgi:hypothetical protein